MSEITDQDLSSIYSNLSSCSPLVRGLAERLKNAEKQLEVWRNDERARCLDVSRLYEENTALRERMKRMEDALIFIEAHSLTAHQVKERAQAALKEGGE